MRRMLSGLLATAMVASVCATASFAVSRDASSAYIKVDFKDFTANGATGANTTVNITATLPEGGDITFTCTTPLTNLPTNDEEWAQYFYRNVSWNVSSDAVFGNGARMKNNDLSLQRSGTEVCLVTKVAGKDVDFKKPEGKNVVVSTDGGWAALATPTYVPPYSGLDTDADLTKDNIPADIRDIIVCDEHGEPYPLTEEDNGVDKDQNNGDGVQSGQTVYFMVRNDMQWKFHDDTYWKMKLSKGDNGKYISSISDVTKTFADDLYNVYTHSQVPGTGGTRARYIKVVMNELYTDDELKVTLDMRLTPKSKAEDVFGVDDDAELKIQDFYFYVKNIVKAADGDWRVGITGLMLDPVKNDWNEVTYYDEDGDVAYMKFFGDSDTGKFYSKLSTKWEHADYASYFNDQDAYIFQFTGSPNLSSTSRADLQIYNPFVDDAGNETIDPETATIYQVVDGDLFDITDSFSYEEGDNGDMAYCTRTRFLGTYIICEKPVEEATDDGDIVDLVPDDLVPDDNTGAPVNVTPGNSSSGGKTPANTGKF